MERSALEVGSWLTTIGLRSSITISNKGGCIDAYKHNDNDVYVHLHV